MTTADFHADFPRLLAAFFTDRLMQQLQASPHTIASYRDTFRLLVRHARKVLKKAPTELELGDLNTDFLGAFLSHLENQRGNDARTRNTRLAAIRSFFGYVASHEPQHAALAQRVLAMPNKRHTRCGRSIPTRMRRDMRRVGRRSGSEPGSLSDGAVRVATSGIWFPG